MDDAHDNLQYVAEQLEEIVRNYTNHSKDTQIRYNKYFSPLSNIFRTIFSKVPPEEGHYERAHAAAEDVPERADRGRAEPGHELHRHCAGN